MNLSNLTKEKVEFIKKLEERMQRFKSTILRYYPEADVNLFFRTWDLNNLNTETRLHTMEIAEQKLCSEGVTIQFNKFVDEVTLMGGIYMVNILGKSDTK